MNDARKPNRLRDVADDELERRHVVGGDQRVGVPEVDLVLAGRDFVVRRLHLEAHFHELLDDDPADLLAPVDRGEVEVAAESCVVVVGVPSADFSNRKNSASQPAIIVKPSFRARSSCRLSVVRGHPAKGCSSGV